MHFRSSHLKSFQEVSFSNVLKAGHPVIKKVLPNNQHIGLLGIKNLNPVVTIGICVKNNESTISKVIDSVINQDFPHELMEVLIADDSKDKTPVIIKELLSKTAIQTSFLRRSSILGDARQLIVSEAKGRYIVWVDGDVILSKTYVKQLENFMETHSDVAIAVGMLNYFNHDNWISLLENIGYVVESLNDDGRPTYKLLGTRGSIFRVDAIRQIGGFDREFTSHEDTDVAYRLKIKGWKFYTIKATFNEIQKTNWNDIWRRHCWYGYGLHFLKHKNKRMKLLSNRTNDWVILSPEAYRLTHRKVVFLLPLNFIFRKVALLYGFLRSHIDGYGHEGSVCSHR